MTRDIGGDPKIRAIICDIDGTVALRGERSPYDYSRVGEDEPNLPIVHLVETIGENRDIIFVSGREDSCFDDTRKWLEKHLGFYFLDSVHLFMRKTGDGRKDSIVKQEIYETHIKDKYQVDYVLDDRNQVVAMWRSLGLVVLQVAEGTF